VGVKGVAKGCWAVGSRSGGPLLGVAQATADGVVSVVRGV